MPVSSLQELAHCSRRGIDYARHQDLNLDACLILSSEEPKACSVSPCSLMHMPSACQDMQVGSLCHSQSPDVLLTRQAMGACMCLSRPA